MAYGPGRVDKIRLRGLSAPTGYVFSMTQSASAFLCHTRYCFICPPHESLYSHLANSFVLSNRLDSVTLQLANYLWLTQPSARLLTNNCSRNHLLKFLPRSALTYPPDSHFLLDYLPNLSSPRYWGMTTGYPPTSSPIETRVSPLEFGKNSSSYWEYAHECPRPSTHRRTARRNALTRR